MDIERPPKWKRFLKKATRLSLILVPAALLAGTLIQQHRDADFHAKHPPPGSFAQVDGHRMHYRLSGEGDITFVLEAGLGGYSGNWGTLESDLVRIGHVFVYDRAGLGWSETSPAPRTAEQIARELHQLLSTAQIPGPYILVGHSLGGLSQIRLAMDYPDGIAALLLIDPSHKDQGKRLPAPPVVFTYLFPQISRAAPLGLPQLLFGSSDPVQNLSSHVKTTGAELRAFLAIDTNWGDRPLRVGKIPLYLLTAGDWQGMPGNTEAEKRASWETGRTMHAELVASSTSEIRRQIVVEGASHYIHQTHRAIVIDVAQELVGRIRAIDRK